MKLNIGNKILMLLHWLCSLMICIAFALYLLVPGLQASLVSKAEGALGVIGARIAGCLVLALYLALSVATLLTLVAGRKRAERGFIDVGPDEKGKVRIAVSAVEQMVRQSVQAIDGIADMKVDIEGLGDAIDITINAIIASGAHVPTITANMQRAITQFVEVNCGVAVQSVEITINAVSGRSDLQRRRLIGRGKARPAAAAPSPAPEPLAADAVETDRAQANDEHGGKAPEGIWEGVSATSNGAPEAKTSAYDPDKPYESEFAKDYAAMLAREDAGLSDAREAGSDGE